MPTAQAPAELTVEQILGAVKQLPPQDFERFEQEWERVRRQKRAEEMKALRTAATYRIPRAKQKRLSQLMDRNKVGMLTPEEKQELDALMEWVDQKDLEKAHALLRLKQLGEDVKKLLEEPR